MGNARVTLPEELHDLVRDVVADLESATGGLGLGVTAPPPPAPRRERRGGAQATILRLPAAEPLPSPPPAPPPASGPPSPPPFADALPVPAAAPRRRAFLARVEVRSSVPATALPARTRRLPVACRRASALDATRISRMLRVAVPAIPVTPAPLVAPPAWLLAAMAPPGLAPPPAAGDRVGTPFEIPAQVPIGSPAGPPAVTLPGRASPPAAAAADLSDDAPPGARPLWRDAAGHVTNLLIAAALGLVAIFCAIVVGLVVTGHHLEQVVTGSMQPTIPIGSLVVTERLPTSQLQVGDILVFPNPGNVKETIVHRIVWLSHDQSGDVLVRTKGDYNALPDSWTLKRASSADADKVIDIVPGGGTLAGYLQTVGFWGLLVLIVGVIGYYGLRKVRQILREDTGELSEPAP